MSLYRILHKASTTFLTRMQHFSPTVIFWSHDGMTSGFKSCHTKLCLENKKGSEGARAEEGAEKGSVAGVDAATGAAAAASAGTGAGAGGGTTILKRQIYSGKVRMGFIPEEFFQFLHSKTGVTGPYILMLAVANYLISKEIYVMEHEYYLGLSEIVVIIYVVKVFGKKIGASLDKNVDEIQSKYENIRNEEIKSYEDIKSEAEKEIWRAEGQKLLMDAKKENVLMQLEAEYRKRALHVYKRVKGTLDYHQTKHIRETKIHQKWMIEWILQQVLNSITPDFEKRALNAALDQLKAVAK